MRKQLKDPMVTMIEAQFKPSSPQLIEQFEKLELKATSLIELQSNDLKRAESILSHSAREYQELNYIAYNQARLDYLTATNLLKSDYLHDHPITNELLKHNPNSKLLSKLSKKKGH